MTPRDFIEREIVREHLFEIRRHLQIAKICENREEINEHIGYALGYMQLLERPGQSAEEKIA